MMEKVIRMPPRHDQPGLYALADLPQRDPVDSIAISTGWWELDQIFKIYPGQLVMVTGIPGHGKSTFLMNLICNLFEHHSLRSFLYVPENEQHIRHRLSLLWGGRQNWEVFANIGCFVQSSEVETYDAAPKTLDWVLDQAIACIKNDGVKVILIDPWNELERAKPREMQLTDYIGQVLMYLKRFSRLFGVTVLLVAHPTKAGVQDKEIPSLSDIEGSMNWYNKCDNGLIVARADGPNVTKIVSAKVREIGAGKRGVCFFDVDPDTGIFTPQHGAVS